MLNIKLTQNYFIVENPLWIGKKTEGGLIIPEEARKNNDEKKAKENFEKLMNLKVLKIGPSCTTIKEGDEVFINSNLLMQGGGIRIELDEKGYLIFREQDVVFIY